MRERGTPEQQALLSPWPVDRPRNWIDTVNRPLPSSEQDPVSLWRRS